MLELLALTGDELVLDVGEKSVCALTTGLLADAFIAPAPTSPARRPRLGARIKGMS